MSDDKGEYKTQVERLQANGTNWVTYRDQVFWAMRAKGWVEHFTNDAITTTYMNAGNVNNLTPDMRWEADKFSAMQWITSTMLNKVFVLKDTSERALE